MTTTRNGGDVIRHAIGARGELILRLQSGRIEVSGVDGDTAIVRDLDGRDLEERFDVEPSDGRLAVRPRERAVFDLGLGLGRWGGRGSARLSVEVPRHATVSLDTANGDIDAHDLHGDQRYRTASGDITVADASGPIGIDAVSGSARIEAAGPIELSGRLVSGDLAVLGGSLRSIALATTSGDIELGSPIDGPGPYSIQTVSGDARLTAAGNLRIEAKTLTGEIASDLEHRMETGIGRRGLVIGTGTRTLAFKSISGDLRIAAHGAPAGPRAVVSAEPDPVEPPDSPEPPEPPAPPATSRQAEPTPDVAGATPDVDPRLAVLRDLEAGTIDVDAATRRLAELDEQTDA